MEPLFQSLAEAQKHVDGFIYPNEIELHWGLLICLYPYLTGLVAGAFILASLNKLFNVAELKPTYRLSMLTSLAFLLCATLPLVAHLGHHERFYEILMTPNPTSAMAMFGFVYAWYLMAVLLLEIWFDYRKDLILWARRERFPMKLIHRALALFSSDLSEKALRFDDKAVKRITMIGVPSAFLLHGYVGFIFGSVKANPWWSSVIMPVVFLFSAIVSGIALVFLLYMITCLLRHQSIDMKCADKLADLLLYAMLVDFALEILDFVHRVYEAEESIDILAQLLMQKLFVSLIVVQLLLGMMLPLALLAITRIKRRTTPEEMRRLVYVASTVLVQVGIFSMRWNVVVGGQLFSKSLRGLMTYKTDLLGLEGLLTAMAILILPLVILYVLAKILPPWPESRADAVPPAPSAPVPATAS